MNRVYASLAVTLWFFLLATPALAVDSYRYTHVTIDTPWMIFLFLLVIILLPFILSAILYWYFATKKDDNAGEHE